MNDNMIIKLYLDRNEAAISETAKEYGTFLSALSMNILGDRQDAEECVNDTYLKTWNVIPPQIPVYLKAFLGKIAKNISLDLYRKKHASKRYNGMDVLLSELEECIPASSTVEDVVEEKLLTEQINVWLKGLKKEERIMFVRRYWYAVPAKELAKEFSISENSLNVKLHRLRKSLGESLANIERMV